MDSEYPDGYEPQVPIDDESIPLWVRIEECMRMLDVANRAAKGRGITMVNAEAEYYTQKAIAAFTLKEEGYPVTFISDVIKGIPEVSKAMTTYHAEEVGYKNANEAIQIYKLKLRVLNDEQQRDYEQARRTT